jgi:hypothetical protein
MGLVYSILIQPSFVSQRQVATVFFTRLVSATKQQTAQADTSATAE